MNAMTVFGVLECCAILGGSGIYSDQWMHHPEKGEVYIKSFLQDIEELERATYTQRKSISMITLNSNQKVARELLEARGWEFSDWYGREKNSDYTTKVCIGWKCVTGEIYKTLEEKK